MKYPVFPKFISRTFFALICLVQLFAVGSQICSYEKILTEGDRFIFRVSPADPYDPFRGRYVTFVLRADNVTAAEAELYGDAYAVLGKDGEGRGIITELAKQPPENAPHLKVENYWITDGQASVTLPFNRFYMREDLARKADSLDITVLSRIDASVRVRNGKGVIEELLLNGMPLSEYLKAE